MSVDPSHHLTRGRHTPDHIKAENTSPSTHMEANLVRLFCRACALACPRTLPRFMFAPHKISWTASINRFLRDFDVLDIREEAVVSGQLYVRRFEASHLVVMPIIVGQEAHIRAGSVMYGGSKVGQNWLEEPRSHTGHTQTQHIHETHATPCRLVSYVMGDGMTG